MAQSLLARVGLEAGTKLSDPGLCLHLESDAGGGSSARGVYAPTSTRLAVEYVEVARTCARSVPEVYAKPMWMCPKFTSIVLALKKHHRASMIRLYIEVADGDRQARAGLPPVVVCAKLQTARNIAFRALN
ncbi:hypothetical protein BN1723_016610 [Verticillium longisporum]|uniref:Uncharacterized protein n=1 Tax=Verticillium longisporum TaxID=100787 RepID=A0A0G4LT09_VERLO|nr:hypothetical protein BN1708_014124 [Verticillium longisporum]CRK45913.1 hypothetical protein BN1723_016610 [Verticillium longisporum]